VRTAAYSDDSGATWKLSQNQPGGFRSAAGLFSGNSVIVIGPNGSDVSEDNGAHWAPIDTLNFNALSMHGDDAWAVGAKGTIARFHSQLK